MLRKFNISEARARLPELARYVIDAPERVVMIEHRDLPDALVLTTAGHMEFLTTRIRELEKRVAPAFCLAGSIQSPLTADELEDELEVIRQEQRASDEQRLRRMSE